MIPAILQEKQGCAIKSQPRRRRLFLHNDNSTSLHSSLFSLNAISENYFFSSIVGINSLFIYFGTLYHTLASILRCPHTMLKTELLKRRSVHLRFHIFITSNPVTNLNRLLKSEKHISHHNHVSKEVGFKTASSLIQSIEFSLSSFQNPTTLSNETFRSTISKQEVVAWLLKMPRIFSRLIVKARNLISSSN